MKKTSRITALLISLSFLSCNKDKDEPTTTTQSATIIEEVEEVEEVKIRNWDSNPATPTDDYYEVTAAGGDNNTEREFSRLEMHVLDNDNVTEEELILRGNSDRWGDVMEITVLANPLFYIHYGQSDPSSYYNADYKSVIYVDYSPNGVYTIKPGVYKVEVEYTYRIGGAQHKATAKASITIT